jgi:Ca-activated chloride channel family protein
MALAVRTTCALLLAASSVTGAVLLSQRAPEQEPPPPIGCIDIKAPERADDGMQLTARFTSQQVMQGEQQIAITISAPAEVTKSMVRPPLAVAIVIDRSGSMDKVPIENARAAAKKLVQSLDASDAFSIITFSDEVETVAPIAVASATNKDLALRAIDGIRADGVTCASCGLDRAVKELALTPDGMDRVHRIVFLSDGQANAGIYDPEELVKHAGEIAGHGTSITAVGVGLDFDEVTMTKIAEVGRGNYYFVEDTAKLDAMFARELGGLTQTVATDVQLIVPSSPDFVVEEAYGYPSMRSGEGVVIPVSDLRAGEMRKVVLRVKVTAPIHGSVASRPMLSWHRAGDGEARHADASLAAMVVADPAQVAATIDVKANTAAQQAVNAQVLEQATAVYEKDGYEAAAQVIRHRQAEIHAMPAATVDAKLLNELDLSNGEALDTLQKVAPAKAKKAVRAKAFEQSR